MRSKKILKLFENSYSKILHQMCHRDRVDSETIVDTEEREIKVLCFRTNSINKAESEEGNHGIIASFTDFKNKDMRKINIFIPIENVHSLTE
ncbi:TPA: hypothetical protein H1008_03500 [archaeon]|nr:hypothetical protein [Candidatus Undinarchaeales archaeon SRR5007147.bin71]